MDNHQKNNSEITNLYKSSIQPKRLKPELYKSKYFQQIIEKELRTFKKDITTNIESIYRHRI